MGEKTKDCIFCKIAGKEITVPIKYEDESIIAFNDKNPQAPVHVLIIPKEHIATLNDVTNKTEALLGKMAIIAKEIAEKEKVSASGYRVVINCGENGGQLIEHLHMHLLGDRKLSWPPG